MILTARLRLRALTLRDLALFRALYCDAATMRHVGRPLSSAEARASLHATVAATRQPGGLRFYAMTERQSRRGVGLCSLRPAAWDKFGVEAGLMLLPAASGRGYAREALSALIETAFFQLRANAVWVEYRRANADAAKLCDELGFGREVPPQAGTNVRRCVRIPLRPERRDISSQPARGATMSNIIGFLEQVGRDATVRHASREALLRAMHEEEIAPEHRSALLLSQRVELDDLTSARETMYCSNQAIKAPQKKKAPAKKKPAKKAPAKKPAKKAPAKKPAKKAPAKRKK